MSGPVSQRARNAAAECHSKSCYEIVRIQGVQCKNGYADGDYLVQAFQRVIDETRTEVTAPLLAENEALKARVAQLEGSLGPFAFAAKNAPNINRRPHDFVLTSEFEAARAALEGGCDGQG